ncbi:MAG: hypothetical protein J5746_00665 [Victivallales bacterium]|nr:hypothetical protein [Victivallales bacterium]
MKWTLIFVLAAVLVGCQNGPRVESGTMLSSGKSTQTVLKNDGSAIPETVEALGNVKDLIEVRVDCSGGNKEANDLATQIAKGACGGIAKDMARVVKWEGDVEISVNVALELVDVDGEYRRLNAVIDLEMRSTREKNILDTRKIYLKGTRKLGAAAVSQFEAPAVREVVAWAKECIRRIASEEYDVAVITFALPRPVMSLVPLEQRDAYNVKAIGQCFMEMKGVVSAKCILHNTPAGQCQYRVVYLKGTYPHGIVNEAVLRVRGIKQVR